jgi:anti-anti-sigma factor
MELTLISETETMNQVKLSGRPDTPGVDRVEARFNAATVARGRDAVVDLGEVTFITSMGIRMLIAAAKAMAARGRRLVLLDPVGVADETLRAADIYTVIPMVRSRDEAEQLCAG